MSDLSTIREALDRAAPLIARSCACWSDVECEACELLRAIREFTATTPDPDTSTSSPSSPRVDVTRALTAAVRAADQTHIQTGGSSRHYVRECLMPALEEHGLQVCPVEADHV